MSLLLAALLAIHPPENLVASGVPPIPDALAEAAARYAESRYAALAGWHATRRELTVLTRFADTIQLHQVAFPGGARRQLTFFPDRIFAARTPPAGDDHFVFAKDRGGNEFHQLYRFDRASGAITLLTDGRSRNVLGPYSRDGKWLAYTSTRRTGKDTDLYVIDPRRPDSDRRVAELAGGGWSPLDISPDNKRALVLEYVSVNESYLWLFDLASGKGEPLNARTGEKIRYDGGRFLPDGRSVLTATDKGSEFLRLTRVDLATRAHHPLTAHIAWDVDAFDVTRDGRLAAVVMNEAGLGVLHLIDLATGRARPRPRLPTGSVEDVAFAPSGRELAFELTSSGNPTDVYSLDVRTAKIQRWTHSETGGLDFTSVPAPELVRWKSFDGREISGFLDRPPARFTGPRPVIINIHGGPESQKRPEFLGRWRYLIDELGVAMLGPNVRGSTGFGKTFSTLDNGRLREDAVKDIGALLDWIRTRPDLDAGRVMIMGGSYGGYMTFASSVHFADRIRCSLSVVGIANFISFLERTEGYRRDLRRVEYGDERDPEMRAFFTKISPLNNATKIKKPILIVQGQNDPRVPAFEAEQMIATLRKQGTPVWSLLAKDEGHGFAKKRNADFLFYTTVAFVQEHLLK